MSAALLPSLALDAIAVVLIVCTCLPLFRQQRHWIFRSMDFPRLQIFCIALAWLLTWFIFRDHLEMPLSLVLAVFISMAYQLRWILPSTRLYSNEVPASSAHNAVGSTFTLLTSNVLTKNKKHNKLINLIGQHQPDIFATLESDALWERSLDKIEGYPHTIKCPLDNLYGMHVYSKLPLTDTTIDYLVEDDVPSMSARVKLPDGRTLRLHVLHPAPPSPSENTYSTERDVELMVLAKALEDVTEPTIVAGDLNDVAWSASTRLFRRLSGLLDPRVGRGLFNTFHADHWFARWPLDHVFVSDHFHVKQLLRLPHIGSDHFPMLVELSMNSAANFDDHPERDQLDKDLLAETMDTDQAKQASKPTLR